MGASDGGRTEPISAKRDMHVNNTKSSHSRSDNGQANYQPIKGHSLLRNPPFWKDLSGSSAHTQPLNMDPNHDLTESARKLLGIVEFKSPRKRAHSEGLTRNVVRPSSTNSVASGARISKSQYSSVHTAPWPRPTFSRDASPRPQTEIPNTPEKAPPLSSQPDFSHANYPHTPLEQQRPPPQTQVQPLTQQQELQQPSRPHINLQASFPTIPSLNIPEIASPPRPRVSATLSSASEPVSTKEPTPFSGLDTQSLVERMIAYSRSLGAATPSTTTSNSMNANPNTNSNVINHSNTSAISSSDSSSHHSNGPSSLSAQLQTLRRRPEQTQQVLAPSPLLNEQTSQAGQKRRTNISMHTDLSGHCRNEPSLTLPVRSQMPGSSTQHFHPNTTSIQTPGSSRSANQTLSSNPQQPTQYRRPSSHSQPNEPPVPHFQIAKPEMSTAKLKQTQQATDARRPPTRNQPAAREARRQSSASVDMHHALNAAYDLEGHTHDQSTNGKPNAAAKSSEQFPAQSQATQPPLPQPLRESNLHTQELGIDNQSQSQPWKEIQWRQFSIAVRDSLEGQQMSLDSALTFLISMRSKLPLELQDMTLNEIVKRLVVWIRSTDNLQKH